MRRIPIYSLSLLLTSAAALAQTSTADSPITQAMLAEIRQLRNDLQTTAATIQRVQIVMYRLQSEAVALDRVTQRLDQLREACNQAEAQQKEMAVQIQWNEDRRRNSQTPAEQKAAEQMLPSLKSSAEMLTTQVQQCQVQQADAESQLRSEQTKMTDLQDHLDKLDKLLAGYAAK